MTTEREKMTAGEPYQQFDKELIDRRVYIRQQLEEINHITDNQNRNDRFKPYWRMLVMTFSWKPTLSLITALTFTLVITSMAITI